MAAPELRLNVTLDLAAFRTQLTKLTSTAKSEIEDQDKIAIPVGIKSSVTKKDATAVTSEIYKTIKESALQGSGGKIRIPVSIKPSITKKDVTDFKKAVQDSLSGISVNVKANVQGGGFAGSPQGAAGLMQYMQQQGMIGKTASGMTMSMRNKSTGGSGFRSLPEGASQAGAGVEFSEMMRRFRGEIAALTTDPKKYEQLLNALPDRRITTDLTDVASRRSRAAEMPSFMPIQQKLGPGELEKKIISDLAQHIKSIRIPNPWVGPTGDYQKFIGNISRTTRQLTSQALLPPSKAVKLLPPGSSSTFQQVAAARTQVAYQRSAARSATVLGGPSAPAGGGGSGGGLPPGGGGLPPSGGVPPSGSGGGGGALGSPSTQLGAGYYAVGKALNSVKSSYGQVQQFLNTKALPLTGAVTGLAGGFGGAIKQVLLFGTAYKALAFLTGIPGEALDAAKGLATYKNQLKAVTSESQTFDQSLAFVDNLAQRFNTPLESARQGFVKLYASMQPVGFDQAQIENLFTGISKAAAAFGLSSDKVDRVNYAFAQMASKGQIMSEELKGQLGDVLPGALGLFAKAAQMSIPEVTKAMEDGAFQGKAMQQVLGNVAILMNSQYGPAAEGAAKTLQGAINQIQNNLKLMYESFAPVVDTFAAAFGPKINSLIKDVSSTVKVLTGDFGKLAKEGEGFSALSPQAQSLYTTIKTLEPSLRQAGAAVLDLASRFAVLIPAIVQTIATAISFASSPLARAAILGAIAVGTLTAALKLLEITGLKAALKAVYAFISGVLSIPAATGLARIGIIGLKLALTGVFVGAILMGLDFLIGKLLGIGDAAAKSKKEIQELDRELDAMAGAGDLEATTKVYMEANTNLIKAQRNYKNASDKVLQIEATSPVSSDMGMTRQVLLDEAKKKAEDAYDKVTNATSQKQKAQTARDNAKNIKEKRLEDELKQEGKLEKIDLSGDDKTKKTNLESHYSLQDQLAKASTQADIDRAQMIFDHQTKLTNLSFDLREARANSFQKDAIRFQRELAQIETDRSNAMLKARADVLIAGGRVAGGVAGAGGATGSTGLLQGSTGISSGPHFDVRRQDGSYISERQARALFDQSVNSQLTMTSPYGPRTAPTAGASSFHRGVDLAGKANTPLNLAAGYSMTGAGEKGGLGYAASIRGPAGEMYDVGHLQRPSAGAGAARKVPGSEGRVIKAEQEQEIALRNQKLIGMQQEELYYGRIAVAIANYAASIFSPEEQQLQNSLLEKRNNLIKLGVSKEDIDLESEKFEKQARFNNGIEEANKKIEENNNLVTKGSLSTGEATRLNAIHNDTIEELRKNLVQLNPLLDEKNKLTKKGAFLTTMGALKDRLAIVKAPTEDAARREELKQEDYRDDEIPRMMAIEEEIARLEELKQKSSDIASSISESITGAFKNIVTGSMSMQEALAGSFRSIGDFFADMVMKMIADYLKLSMLQGIKNIFSMFAPGASAVGGLALGGAGGQGAAGSYGSAMSATSSLPSFTGGGGFQPVSMGNFGVAPFANGGIVTGPTLGLVGEGRYNEAIIPLPDGKSVPVQLAGGTEGATAPINTNIVVNVKNGQSDSQVTGNQGNQLGREIEGAVRQVILKEIRPGGIIYGSR